MKIKKFSNIDQCSRHLAEAVVAALQQAVSERSRASLVLGGGDTPRRLYAMLAKWGEKPAIPWDRIHLFWGDERFVPLDDPESNYRMAYETLISRIVIPAENVHRPPVHRSTPELAAMAYEAELRAFFADFSSRQERPLFDVVLLGMGEDGHTASLFPGVELTGTHHWVTAVRSSRARPPVPRISLTLALLNQAHHVFFLAAGQKKIDLVETIRQERAEGVCSYPAGCVDPAGELVWFVAESGESAHGTIA